MRDTWASLPGSVVTVPNGVITQRGQPRLDSYRRLADVFHDVLSEHDVDALLERIADTLADLIPYDSLTIYRAVESDRLLVPVLARDQWAEEILGSQMFFGEGLTGWAAEHRRRSSPTGRISIPGPSRSPALPRSPRQSSVSPW